MGCAQGLILMGEACARGVCCRGLDENRQRPKAGCGQAGRPFDHVLQPDVVGVLVGVGVCVGVRVGRRVGVGVRVGVGWASVCGWRRFAG